MGGASLRLDVRRFAETIHQLQQARPGQGLGGPPAHISHKERLVRFAPSLSQVEPERVAGGQAEVDGAALVPLAYYGALPGMQVNVADFETTQLRGADSRIYQKQQNSLVPARLKRMLRGLQQGLHLVRGERLLVFEADRRLGNRRHGRIGKYALCDHPFEEGAQAYPVVLNRNGTDWLVQVFLAPASTFFVTVAQIVKERLEFPRAARRVVPMTQEPQQVFKERTASLDGARRVQAILAV